MRCALTIAGSDSVGGAGIEADIKAMSSLDVHCCAAITAVTAQNTTAVKSIYPLPLDMIQDQIETVLKDVDIKAVKTGMLYSAEIAATPWWSATNSVGRSSIPRTLLQSRPPFLCSAWISAPIPSMSHTLALWL